MDERPRTALATAVAWTRGDASVGDAMRAAQQAHAAAREAASESATFAARAAGHAVATAHMADHSLGASFYALKALASKGLPIAPEFRWQMEQLPDEVRDLVISALARRFGPLLEKMEVDSLV